MSFQWLFRLIICHITSFFKIKDRSTIISFKKKKQLYITNRSIHHPHKNNTRKQHNQKNSRPPQPGREDKGKPPRTAPSSPTLCHAKSRSTLQVLSDNSVDGEIPST
jgi:hypothetical protein